MHLRFAVHLSIFVVDIFFFVSQANWYFSLCFLQRSNGFFAWSYFSVCKCLKSRVQPQTSFLSTKKPSLEMLFLFFLHFICSSSFVHHLSFVYSLQMKSTNTFMWYFPLIFFFFCRNLFFFGFSTKLVWFCMFFTEI